MPRPSGGYAAGYVTPVLSANAAAGVWTPRDLYANRAAGTWPVVGTATPAYAAAGYTRLWGVTTKSSGLITGTAASDTGQYNVKWWDNTISNYLSGATFSKAAAGGYRAFEIYPTALLTPNTVGSSGGLLGLAAISTTQSKFGGASARFANSGDVIKGNVTFNWSSNWTLEMWLRREGEGFGGAGTVFQANNIGPGTGGVHLYVDGSGQIELNDGLSNAATAGGIAPFSEWVHIAVVRASGINTLYVAGVAVGGTSTQTFPVTNTAYSIGGSTEYSFHYDGYIDDVRLTQSAVYSGASFTPPAAALSAISGTALLFPFNSSAIGPFGQFDAFNVSGTEINKLRAESVVLSSAAGYYQHGYQTGTYPYYNYFPGQYVPGVMEQGNLSNNSLNAAALDQFYNDLSSGSGALYVAGNPGIATDDPTIATAKGYTVYGSVPPSTSLLLNLNGSNGSTTFTDSSPNSITVTANGNAAISTTQSKFGGASAFFDGVGTTKASFTSSSLFQFDGDFTIEAWVRLTANGAFDPILSAQTGMTDQTGWLLLQINQVLYFLGSNGSSWVTVLNAGVGLTLNQWSHVAVTRSGSSVRLFINGSQVAIGAATTSYSQGVTGYLGHYGINGTTPTTMTGYLDDVRIIKGAALYTANFTPPTAQLSVWYP